MMFQYCFANIETSLMLIIYVDLTFDFWKNLSDSAQVTLKKEFLIFVILGNIFAMNMSRKIINMSRQKTHDWLFLQTFYNAKF